MRLSKEARWFWWQAESFFLYEIVARIGKVWQLQRLSYKIWKKPAALDWESVGHSAEWMAWPLTVAIIIVSTATAMVAASIEIDIWSMGWRSWCIVRKAAFGMIPLVGSLIVDEITEKDVLVGLESGSLRVREVQRLLTDGPQHLIICVLLPEAQGSHATNQSHGVFFVTLTRFPSHEVEYVPATRVPRALAVASPHARCVVHGVGHRPAIVHLVIESPQGWNGARRLVAHNPFVVHLRSLSILLVATSLLQGADLCVRLHHRKVSHRGGALAGRLLREQAALATIPDYSSLVSRHRLESCTAHRLFVSTP